MNKTQTTGPDTFDHMTRDDRWLGFGYLGERRNELESTDEEALARPDLVAAVDALVLAYATEQGWTADDLFTWANSKLGRWFADSMFGTTGSTLEARFAQAQRAGLLKVVA